ncbi:MAG TPA: hydroxymethylbilane synthase [Magnetospirillaceae bacterium]|jgi:hydroxymethylbilane synthase
MADMNPLRIGTRGSPLALVQARNVQARLAAAHPGLADAIAIEAIVTSGDTVQDRTLVDIGGKGLFTKEIDAALLDGRVALAVHSLKDLPTVLPDGIALVCVPEREDPRDALISSVGDTIASLPKGAVVGTASLRRAAQLLHRRPDLKTVPLRGNVGTRIAKLDRGEVQATLLAMAGLRRLGATERAHPLSTDEILPAVGQGALAITCRSDDKATRDLLAPLDHADAHTAILAERAFLAELDGSCRTPIAALAEVNGDRLTLRGLIATPDGKELLETQRDGHRNDAARMGKDAGAELLKRCGPAFFAFKG